MVQPGKVCEENIYVEGWDIFRANAYRNKINPFALNKINIVQIFYVVIHCSKTAYGGVKIPQIGLLTSLANTIEIFNCINGGQIKNWWCLKSRI